MKYLYYTKKHGPTLDVNTVNYVQVPLQYEIFYLDWALYFAQVIPDSAFLSH